MKTRLLLPLLTASVFAQSPAAPAAKIPRPPQLGADVKTAPVPVTKSPATEPRRSHGGGAATTASPAAAAPLPRVPGLPADLLLFDAPGNGRILAAARGWKAEFAADHWCFRPFLGSDATAPAAVEFALTRATAGGTALALAPGEPVRAGHRIELDRRACRERFDVDSAGVEQSFVFDRLPAGGDLVLDLTVATTLRAEPDGHGWRFLGERGGIACSDAVAVDAGGRRCPLQPAMVDGALRLVVPADFVATACLPLVVDPTITPVVFCASTAGEELPQVAWLPYLGQYLAVWQHDFSATDRDVYGLTFNVDMQGAGSIFALDLTAESWELPHVASCELAHNFMMVAQVSNGGVSPFWIGARTWEHGVGTGAPFVVERAGLPGHLGGDKLRPDIGGDPFPAGPVYYTVVWERVWQANDHDIHMKQVTPAGVLRSAAPTLLDNGGSNESHPRISRTDGAGGTFQSQHWTVVWQRTYSPTDEDVYGCELSWDGQLLVPVIGIALSADDERDPCASSPTASVGGARRHLLAWSRHDPVNDWDIVVALHDQTGTQLTSDWLGYAEGGGPEQAWPQVRPDVDCDGTRFAVAYSEYSAAGTAWDTRVSLCAFDPVTVAMVVQEARVGLGITTGQEGHVAIAAQGAAGGEPSRYGVAYDLDDLAGNLGVVSQPYDGYAGLPLPSTRATGCGGLGIQLDRLPTLGATLTFTQTDNGPLTGFLFGFPRSLPLPFCGGCEIGVDGNVVPNPFVVTVPLVPALVGLPLSSQAFTLNAGPCLLTAALSDTIDFQLL